MIVTAFLSSRGPAGVKYAIEWCRYSPSLRVELADRSGQVELLFYGRRQIEGISPGVDLVVTGRLASLQGRRTLANPAYELVPAPRPHAQRVGVGSGGRARRR